MMIVAGVLGSLVACALTYWLHRRLVVASGLAGRWARVVDVVLVGGLLAGVGAFLVGGTLDPAWARPLGYLGFTWWAFIYYLSLGLLVVGIVAVALRVAAGRGEQPRRWIAVANGAIVVAAATLVGYGLVEANRPTVTEESARIAQLPEAFDGLRVALVTDLHVGPARGAGFTRRVVEQVNAARPDLIILGGDLADGTVAHVGRDLEPLSGLRAPLGVYGVSGNHEYYHAETSHSWLDFWPTLGIRPLRNERVELHRNGAVLDLAGVYDATAPAPYEPDVDAALRDRDPGRALLFVAHEPIQAHDAQNRGIGLQLSGHTHGGQLWPFGYAVRLQQPVVAGFGRVGDVPVFVSRGTGAWGPPVRVGAPPQIVVVKLNR